MDMGEEPENKDNNDKMMKETTVFGQHTDVFKESWGLSVKQTVYYVNGEKTENEVVVPMEEGEDNEIVLITEVKIVEVDNVEHDIINQEQIYSQIDQEEGSNGGDYTLNNSMEYNKDNITEEEDKQ